MMDVQDCLSQVNKLIAEINHTSVLKYTFIMPTSGTVGPKILGADDARVVVDVVHGDVAVVLDVLHLLPVPVGLLQRLDDQGRGGGAHANLG